MIKITKNTFPVYFILSILGILCLGTYIWLSTKPNTHDMPSKGKANKTFVVKTIQATIKPMPITLEEVGTVAPAETVTIIPQVSGALKKIAFDQNHHVNAGQLLFELDPTIYQANLDLAKANIQRDQSQLSVLKATAERYQALAKLEYVPLQQYEQAAAAFEAQKATVAADTVQMQQAETQLSYTQIHSPIAGKPGNVTVHEGDFINANSATPLVVINRLDPILIIFNVSQDQLPQIRKLKEGGTLKVEIISENNSEVLVKGELVFIDNNVNNQTGTVTLKAKAANANHLLWPGQIVTIKLILAVEETALVIPDVAVQMGQKGHYVYVVRNNKAVIQPVTIARQLDHQAVVAKGLQLTDKIISEVPPGITDGSSIQLEGHEKTQMPNPRKIN